MKALSEATSHESQESVETAVLQTSPLVGGSGGVAKALGAQLTPPSKLSHWGAFQKDGINFNPDGTSPLACGFLSSTERVPGQDTVKRRKERFCRRRESRDHNFALKTLREEQAALNAEAVALFESRAVRLAGEVSASSLG